MHGLLVSSPLVEGDDAGVLELWGGGGSEIRALAELGLEQLDLPPALLAALARSAADGPCIERLDRIPGIHYVLVVPLRNRTVLTVGVGPRTRLLAPERVARFLRGDAEASAPYTISLSPPVPTTAANVGHAVERRRDQWTARGERLIDHPGGSRHGDPLGRLGGRGPLTV